ncbi:MAG: DMT family transporter [Candidatus Pacebacteria bacterium]|nr:DMT family transporter [Candidatus Paceibacterota bacterium]
MLNDTANHNHHVLTYVLLCCMALMWGLVFIAIKLGGQAMPISVFTADRYLLGTALFAFVTWHTGRWRHINWRDAVKLTVLGLIGQGFMQVAFSSGIMRTATASAALIYGCTPLLVATLSALFGVERLRPRQWFGSILAFAGMAAVVTGNGTGFAGQTALGDGLVVVAIILLALYVIWSRSLIAKLGIWVVITWVLGVGALVTLVWSVPEQTLGLYQQLQIKGWLILLYGAIFALMLPNLIFLKGIHEVGRAKASLFINAVPLIGCAAGWLIMGETMGAFQVMGGGLIVTGLILANTTARMTVSKAVEAT